MSLTFYFAPMSTASITELVLEELGVPVEKVRLDLRQGASKTPEFLALNPNGKVPCVVHDGTAIWESAALTIYLGETFGVERKLFPAAGTARGQAMSWIVWTNVSLGDGVTRYTRNTMPFVPAEEQNAAAGESAKRCIHDHLRVLDAHLDGKPYLLGADYSLADTHVHSYTDWIRHLQIDFAAYSHLNAWAARCGDRPVYKKVLAAGA